MVCVIARELTDNLTSLVKQLNAKVSANAGKNMAGFVVFLTTDPDKLEPKLQTLAKESKIDSVPLTLVEGVAGPPAYKIAKDADVTVLMWVDGEVKVNHAYKKGQLDKAAIAKILADSAKILQ